MVSLITYQMDDINLEKVQYLLLMHGQRLAAKNLSVSFVNFNYVASSSMNVNVSSYWSRNGMDLVIIIEEVLCLVEVIT